MDRWTVGGGLVVICIAGTARAGYLLAWGDDCCMVEAGLGVLFHCKADTGCRAGAGRAAMIAIERSRHLS